MSKTCMNSSRESLLYNETISDCHYKYNKTIPVADSCEKVANISRRIWESIEDYNLLLVYITDVMVKPTSAPPQSTNIPFTYARITITTKTTLLYII